MANPISLTHFIGMNNIKQSEGLFNEKGFCEPRIILNADVSSKGRVIKRDGSEKIISLTNPHSLWAGTEAILCVASGYLYRILQGEAIQLCSIDGPDAQTFYVEYEGKVYISNKYWKKIYNPASGALSSWGMSLPIKPTLSSTAGNLSAGIYNICFTKFSGNEIGGNGQIAVITIKDSQGIEILGRSADEIVWITDPNGNRFYFAGEVDKITGETSSTEPLPSFLCSPPPLMENIFFAFGRIWGSVGGLLYYSEPYHPEWFKLQFNRFEFDQDITLVAAVTTGIFVGCEDITYFFTGTEPHQMRQSLAGKGAIPGTLTYCNNLPELGDILSPAEKVHVGVPIWLSQEGIVAGNASGRLFNLSHQKIKFVSGQRGASVYRMKNGEFQFLTSFRQGSMGSGFNLSDDATVEVIRDGRVLKGDWSSIVGEDAGMSESIDGELNL